MPRFAAVGALSVLLIAGCSSQQSTSSAPSAPSTTTASMKIVVFAAAPQKKAFSEIGELFTTENPGGDVEFSFASSADHAAQLTQGAYADVFASAAVNNMDTVAQAGLLAGDPTNFASNILTIAVAPGNPKKIASFADLTRPGVTVAVCAPEIPCGVSIKKIEQATGVSLTPVSQESVVTDVLSKVETGAVDAGLVYTTDALGAGDKVTEVAFPESADAPTTDSIAVLKQSKNPELAAKFVALVTGEAGQKILAANGFAKP
jgi:molybdate transport system substrate-binding protein